MEGVDAVMSAEIEHGRRASYRGDAEYVHLVEVQGWPDWHELGEDEKIEEVNREHSQYEIHPDFHPWCQHCEQNVIVDKWRECYRCSHEIPKHTYRTEND